MKHLTTTSVCCAALTALSVHALAHAKPSAAKVVTGESYGNLSSQVKINTLPVGTRFTF
jgi:hypothetical protein